jgi:hypothetical protein
MGARQPGPQGEHDISVKTIAQGMPDDPAEPVVPSPCVFCARGPWVAASTRHSLRPHCGGTRECITRAQTAPREGGPISSTGSLTSGIRKVRFLASRRTGERAGSACCERRARNPVAAAHPQGSSWSYVSATVAPQTAIFIVMFGAKSFSGPQAIIEAGISLGGQE